MYFPFDVISNDIKRYFLQNQITLYELTSANFPMVGEPLKALFNSSISAVFEDDAFVEELFEEEAITNYLTSTDYHCLFLIKPETVLVNNLLVTQPIVVAGMMVHCYKNTLILQALGVNPALQNQGLGSLMMAMLYQYSNQQYLLNNVIKIKCNPLHDEKTFRFYSKDLRLTKLKEFVAELPINPAAIAARKKHIYPASVSPHGFFHHPDKKNEAQTHLDVSVSQREGKDQRGPR